MSDLDRRFLLGGLAGAAGLSAIASIGRAGPLNPPSGAVASSGKTLTEVEPRIAVNATNTPGDADSVYRITQAGGYYLTANMLVASGKHAIEIAASGVTLDLNGFQIVGFGGLGGIIPSSTAVERITIRNGTIVQLPFGILFTDVPDVTVESIRFETVPGYAVRTGLRGIVRNCTTFNCGGSGGAAGSYAVWVDERSLIEGCIVADSNGWGLSARSGSRVVGCTVTGSASVGMAVDGSVLHCTVRSNGSSGMQVNRGPVINCVAETNAGLGISIDQGLVLDCESNQNGSGFLMGQRSTVRGCIATLNNGNGISATFDQNRIEGNTCTENDKGIYIPDTNGQNVITGNVCINSRIANYDIAVGNVCLVVAAATTAAAILGNTGGVSPGTTSAWANLAL